VKIFLIGEILQPQRLTQWKTTSASELVFQCCNLCTPSMGMN